MTKRTLLSIDMQNDFVMPYGSLCVKGAQKDMLNIVALLEKGRKDFFTDIIQTMDTHRKLHIAHAINWVNKDGNHPEPFTIISRQNVIDGVWKAANPNRQQTFFRYVLCLEDIAKKQLVIWPEHCILGTEGHNVPLALMEAYHAWETYNQKDVHYVFKGYNNDTEHYSAIKAEVTDHEHSETMANRDFINRLKGADEVYVVGEALDFCVYNTLKDLINYGLSNEIYLLQDCTSAINEEVITLKSLADLNINIIDSGEV